MSIKKLIVKNLRNVGYDLTRYLPHQHPDARLARMMQHHKIGMLLDVGANVGQFVEHLRENGYTGRAISFEPLKDAFAELEPKAAKDPKWECRNIALGAEKCVAEINIAGNSTSSSLLPMLSSHEESAPHSKYKGTESIEVETIDLIWDSLGSWSGGVWLKIDTQGFEKQVIEGARRTLKDISCVQMEMSLVPLYKDSGSFQELLQIMTEMGFSLIGILPGFSDKQSGHMLQVDGIFARTK